MSFGTWLARERELRGISLEEVAEATRIPRPTLESIEADDGPSLPGRTYLMGHLRAIAEVLGLDPDDVVLRWEESVGPGGGGAAPERGPAGLRRVWMGLLLLLAALAAGSWALLR